MIRRHFVFTGQVQGVGFRWRARHAAGLYGCTGWCRNEWDGSVTLELQGEEEAVNRVLRTLRDGRYIRIQRMDVTEQAPDPDERGFGIRD